MAELPKLLQRLRSYRGRRQTQLGLRLLLLTGVRTGELRQATPDQFDLDRGLWIIPPDVVKQLQLDMRKKRQQAKDIPPYIVPLSIQAMEIVRHLLDEFKRAQAGAAVQKGAAIVAKLESVQRRSHADRVSRKTKNESRNPKKPSRAPSNRSASNRA
jgi:integrase